MKKPYRCCRCSKGLLADEAIFADHKGVLTIKGKPYCNECLPGSTEEEYDETPEDKIDELTNGS